MSPRADNVVTITLTFSDEDFDELDLVARLAGKSRDEVMAEILSPTLMSKHIRSVLDDLRKEVKTLVASSPEAAAVVDVLKAVGDVTKKYGLDGRRATKRQS